MGSGCRIVCGRRRKSEEVCDLTIRQLEYFLTAAQTLSFTKTARQFYISQSAVTQQIHALEEEFDAKLFLRRNNRIRLTPAGETLVQDAEMMVARYYDAIEKVHAVRDGMSGELRIGYLQGMEMSRFPRTVQEFRADYPGIQISLNRDNAVNLHDDYLNGRYDIIFNVKNSLLRYSNSISKTIGEYPYYVVVPTDHYLSGMRKVKLRQLRYEKLILHDFKIEVPANSEIHPHPFLNKEIMKNVAQVTDDIENILIFVAAGIGIAIVPEFDVFKPQININLSYIPLDTGDYREMLEIVYPEKDANPLLRYFMDKI